MQYNQKIEKMNGGYVAIYILAPIVLFAATILICVLIPKALAGGMGVAICIFIGAIFWWGYGWKILYNKKKKEMDKKLDEAGFARNHTFNGDSCTMILDSVHGDIALLFRFNPFVVQIASVQKIERTWVDDGASGAGVLRGSSRVSFLFIVDGIKVRVNTFISNKRWRMDSNYILDGISKADMMVNEINQARAAVH